MRILLGIFILCLSGCMYQSSYICGDGSNPIMTSDKTVTTSPELQGNIPVQGGTVSNPNQTQTNPTPVLPVIPGK